MAGPILERELTATNSGGLHFDLAGPTDDADLRRLLRENPMRGRISISLEREPSYFHDAGGPGETKQTIIARAGGRLVGAGCCTIRRRFVNGKSRQVGYLGGLRLDARNAGRFDLLRRGYKFFRELQADTPADLYFTSIAADNERARKFLERGLPGMPLYDFAAEYVTLLVPTRNRRPCSRRAGSKLSVSQGPLSSRLADDVVGFLNGYNHSRQLAAHWSPDELLELKHFGLHPSDFYTVRRAGQLVACGALWDQRQFKQTVIRGYAPWLRFARPLLNALARLLRRPRLPGPGETLASAFASHLAFAPGCTDALLEVLEMLRERACQRGIEFLTWAFPVEDPLLMKVSRRFPGRAYHSRLYVVRWPGMAGAALELDDRLPAPEVALL